MKTQTESTQPTSLESRFTRLVYDAYVRSPKQPPLVFQARAPEAWTWCAAAGTGWPTHRSRCPSSALSFVDLQNRGRDAPVTLLPYVGPGWYPKVSVDYMLRSGVVQWSDVLHTMATSPRSRRWRHGAGLARGRRTYGKACSELDDRAHGTRQQQGVHAAQQQQRAGRDRHQAGILRRRRPVRVGLHHHPLNPQQRDATPHPRLRARLRGDDMVARIRRELGLPPVHPAGENGLRGAAGHAEVPRQFGAARPQHVPRDCKPKFRHEEKPLRGKPCMQAEPPARAAGWTDVADPVAHSSKEHQLIAP